MPDLSWHDEPAFDEAYSGRLQLRVATGGGTVVADPATSMQDGYVATFISPGTIADPVMVDEAPTGWRLDVDDAYTTGFYGVYGGPSVQFVRGARFLEVTLVDVPEPVYPAPPAGYHVEVEGAGVESFTGSWRLAGDVGGFATTPTGVALLGAPPGVGAQDATEMATPSAAGGWPRSALGAANVVAWSGGVWQRRPQGAAGDAGTVLVDFTPPSAGGVAVLAPMLTPQLGVEGWPMPDPLTEDSSPFSRVGNAQATTWLRAVEAVAVHRAAWRWRLVSDQRGAWRLRQRQSLPGSDSWPLRQRHNGTHSGSWPLRQRQRGV